MPKHIRYIDVSAVSRAELAIVDFAEHTSETAPSRAQKTVRAHDTLFATIRPGLRRVASVPSEFDGAIASTAFCVLRPAAGKIDPQFLFYAVLDDSFVAAVEELQTGASYPAVRDKDVLEQHIPLPPLLEQATIAGALSAVRSLLLSEAKALRLAEAVRQAAMRELFTRGLRGEVLKEASIGLVPENWEVVRLGDLMGIKHGSAFDGAHFRSSGKFVLLTPGHFAESGGFRDQGSKTRYYVGEIQAGYLLAKNALLVVMTEQKPGLLGSSALVPEDGVFLHNQRLGLIVDVDETRLDRQYLYHLLNYDAVRGEISRTATGSKVRHTSPDRIRALNVALPPLREQHDAAAILDAIDRKIRLHRQKKSVLDDLFNDLLHKLMAGEIRVDQLNLSALESLATYKSEARS
jgi:type I restriction enzyme S subunit